MLLLRWAWRYRSELAPAYLAAVILGASWWLHAAHPHWWAVVLGAAVVAAGALAALGARIGIPAPIERLYAATATLAAGGWMAAATALGPSAWPLPQAMAVGGLALSVPWWAHRRRRARVRVERKLEAWPDIAQSRRAGRITGHVRRSGRVGMARPVPPGPRPDHRRRDRQDSRDRIRPRHLPRRGARLPHARRPGQPMRAASSGHRPARRRRRRGPARP